MLKSDIPNFVDLLTQSVKSQNADIVLKLCRQLDVDISNPTVNLMFLFCEQYLKFSLTLSLQVMWETGLLESIELKNHGIRLYSDSSPED